MMHKKEPETVRICLVCTAWLVVSAGMACLFVGVVCCVCVCMFFFFCFSLSVFQSVGGFC